MTLRPLTAQEFRVTTPDFAAEQWSRLGQRLAQIISAESQASEQWRQQRLSGLLTAYQLFSDLSVAALVDPISTWHLMAKTLRRLAESSEGGYFMGIAEAANLQLDAEGMTTRSY